MMSCVLHLCQCQHLQVHDYLSCRAVNSAAGGPISAVTTSTLDTPPLSVLSEFIFSDSSGVSGIVALATLGPNVPCPRWETEICWDEELMLVKSPLRKMCFFNSVVRFKAQLVDHVKDVGNQHLSQTWELSPHMFGDQRYAHAFDEHRKFELQQACTSQVQIVWQTWMYEFNL